MNRETFNAFEQSEKPLNPENGPEKELNPEEIEQLGADMNEYADGLKIVLEELREKLKKTTNDERAKKLRSEITDTEEQITALGECVSDIESGEIESATIKPIN